ncbi:hypothetical protein Taro_003105 [Colocasia esculenta]|uniref:PRONE domain-containing protein n=1 Tax=Colocasia esculenta TaxID=4460 RepID=A0A843TKQ3_COLES|nr:hypothetical protein [Colocasia esculenta]
MGGERKQQLACCHRNREISLDFYEVHHAFTQTPIASSPSQKGSSRRLAALLPSTALSWSTWHLPPADLWCRRRTKGAEHHRRLHLVAALLPLNRHRQQPIQPSIRTGREGTLAMADGLEEEKKERVLRVKTYSGLESHILNNGYSCDAESRSSLGDGATSNSLERDDLMSHSSSSKGDSFASSSSSSHWPSNNPDSCKNEEECCLLEEWDAAKSPYPFYRGRCFSYSKEKVPMYTMKFMDVETMKEKFAKLLLGEDVSGGCRGVATAVALSNAITTLSVSIFGELWKLEPLSDEKKSRWRREMDWLLSPTNYMVELVPAKQSGANGRILEIMTPKARADVHVALPALQKLDSILIEVLDSMVDTEFWYAEGGSRAEGRSQNNGVRLSKRWWLPSPRVPELGLSPSQRKKLGYQGKCVYQVLKAVKSINEQVLLQMPVPDAVKDALPKSGRVSLGEDVYQAISSESFSVEEIFKSLDLKSEHKVLDIVNRLEGAVYAWKERLLDVGHRKSPLLGSWAFARESDSRPDKIEVALQRAEILLQLLKIRFPNLPQTFLDVTKVQYNKDVGRSIIEAYSRVLGNLAFSILARIGDILQEDDLNKPSTPVAMLKFDFSSDVYLAGITETPPGYIKRALINQMDKVDSRVSSAIKPSKELFPEDKVNTVVAAAVASPCRNKSLLLW